MQGYFCETPVLSKMASGPLRIEAISLVSMIALAVYMFKYCHQYSFYLVFAHYCNLLGTLEALRKLRFVP